MASFAALLSQKQPQFQTYQALIILGLQNDFISPEGKLPVPLESGFVERIKELVPKFRELAGDVIWVRTEFEGDRNVYDGSDQGEIVVTWDDEKEQEKAENGRADVAAGPSKSSSGAKKKGKSKKKAADIVRMLSTRRSSPTLDAERKPREDEEIFLSNLSKDGPACMPGTPGADFAEVIQDCIEPSSDMIVVKSHYSAFKETSLLMTLRMKRITELYVCGCMTNLSVYATAVDAARHGLTINIIEDCLGYRTQRRHEVAMKDMTITMGAYTVESADIMWDLNHPPGLEQGPEVDGVEKALSGMSLGAKSKSPASKDKDKDADYSQMEELQQALAKIAIRHSRNRGRVRMSEAELLESTEDEIVSSPSFQRSVREYASQPDLSKGYVKSRIRMRPRAADIAQFESPITSKEHPTISGDSPPADRQKVSPRDGEKKKKKKKKDGESSINEQRLGSTIQPEAESSSATLQTNRSNDTAVPSPTTPKSDARISHTNEFVDIPLSVKEPLNDITEALAGAKTPKRSSAVDQAPVGTGENQMRTMKASKTGPKKQKGLPPDLRTLPTMGPDDRVGEGDSYVKYDLLSNSIQDPTSDLPLGINAFNSLYLEVRWQKMYHAGGEVPRLVAIQGTVDPKDGSKPVYRHPSDQSLPLLPFSSTVDIIRRAAEKVVGHELNHVLIQLYRSGEDHISEHSDKTLDIAHGSSIVNASFGARRTMRLRTKKGYIRDGATKEHDNPSTPASSDPNAEPGDSRTTQRIPMPHNSLFVLGPATNAHWLHGIPPDKRPAAQRDPAELAYDGMRISLTFRRIATFLSADESRIWGQGATGKTKEHAREVVNGDEEQTTRMIRAFGAENQAVGVKWTEWYGEGFDVLHFRDA